MAFLHGEGLGEGDDLGMDVVFHQYRGEHGQAEDGDGTSQHKELDADRGAVGLVSWDGSGVSAGLGEL